MEHKSHRVKIKNLDRTRKPVFQLSTRSKRAILGAWLFAFLLIFIKMYLFAAFVILMAIVISLQQDRKIFEGYSSYFVVYTENNVEYCDVYYISEIKTWEYQRRSGKDVLILNFNNGEKARIENDFEIGVYNYLKKVMPDNEFRREK